MCPLFWSTITATPDLYGSAAIMKKFQAAPLLLNAWMLCNCEVVAAPCENMLMGAVAVKSVLLANTTPLPR